MPHPLFLAALLVSATALVASPLHPEPRSSRPLGGNLTISGDARITGEAAANPAALQVVRACLAPLAAGDGVGQIVIGTRGTPEFAALLVDVPAVSGGYRLRVDPERIVLAGHDARGTYYAALTLRGLLAQRDQAGAIPVIDILDWPEVPHRGIVEGFYGTPWPHAKRLRLIDFLGNRKLDTYIYGPKDDPYHSSPHWRDPYPAAEAAKIRELAAASRARHVDFYWAVHPGKDIQWNKQDEAKVLAKFEAMYQLGVRAFAVFFDDIAGEGTKADRQAGLLNTLHREFVVKKGDVSPLVMCPTQYNKAWSSGDYLDTLGTTLDPAIQVMWTGNSVVSDLDRPSMEWINAKLRRKAFIWWNNPVTDYVRNHLLMGPIYGNAPDIGPLYGGFVANPMERSEASKVALFGVADYTWNPAKFDSEASFLAAMRAIMPAAPEAFATFCRHNSDLGANTHGYRRAESVAFAPAAEQFIAALREEKPAADEAVRSELTRIREAPAAIRSDSDNPLLLEEISPWLDAFEELGRAGVAALDAYAALRAGDHPKTWLALAAANDALKEMAEIDRTQNQNPYQPGVRTGSLVVTPFVKELVDTTNARFLAALAGGSVFRPTGITSGAERDSLPLMLDGKDDTYFYAKEIQKTGDWFGVDLGSLHEVRRIRLLQGRNDDDHDRVHQGILEGYDGDTWQRIAPVTAARLDLTLDPPKKFRSVRVRIEKPGEPGGKPDLWTAIRAFEINAQDAAELRTDIPAFASQPVRFADTEFSISPSLEVHPFAPSLYLGLLFPTAVQATAVTADLKVESPEKHFVLEATSADGGGWQTLKTETAGTALKARPGTPIRALRIRNQGRDTVSVTLAKFAVTIAADSTSNPLTALTDGRLDATTALPSGKTIPIPPGTEPANITLLVSPEWKGSATLEALVGDQRQPLGPIKSVLARFSLPAGIRGVVVSSASPLPLREVIWSTP